MFITSEQLFTHSIIVVLVLILTVAFVATATATVAAVAIAVAAVVVVVARTVINIVKKKMTQNDKKQMDTPDHKTVLFTTIITGKIA